MIANISNQTGVTVDQPCKGSGKPRQTEQINVESPAQEQNLLAIPEDKV